MSYCVNCGVELDPTARVCPLCGTRVINPRCPADPLAPPPFPLHRREVEPVDRRSLGFLLTGVLLSVSACCAVLNALVFFPRTPWSLYVAGAAALLWVWAALPLLARPPLPLCLLAGLAAAAGFLALVAALTGGWHWYGRLALPVVALTGLLGAAPGWCLFRRHSRLTSLVVTLAALGLYLLALEALIDLCLRGRYRPGWSVIAAAAILVAGVFLLVVRLQPRLRAEFRRRFHS